MLGLSYGKGNRCYLQTAVLEDPKALQQSSQIFCPSVNRPRLVSVSQTSNAILLSTSIFGKGFFNTLSTEH